MRIILDKGQPAKKSFGDIFAVYSMMDRNNETVYRLSRDVEAQVSVMTWLSAMGQRHFINLVDRPNQARISMALYAGDGVIAKITPEDYMPHHKQPFVMIPFHAFTVETKNAGRFVIENFPYLRQIETDGSRHVANMRSVLAEHGLVFKKDDDRPENVGIMRNGDLVVQDGDAVELRSGPQNGALHGTLRTWEEKVRSIYSEFHTSGFKYTQSPQTDFSIAARSAPAAPSPAPIKPGAPMPWHKRVFGF